MSFLSGGRGIDGDSLYIRSSESLVRHDSDMLADAIGEALASLFRIANGGDFARLFRCRSNERLPLLSRILGEIIKEEQIISVSTQDLDKTDIEPVLVDIPVMEELVIINNPLNKKTPQNTIKTRKNPKL